MKHREARNYTIMFFAFIALSCFGLYVIKPVPCDATENPCPDGRLCPSSWSCCARGCCVPVTAISRRDDEPFKEPGYVYPWYAQWPVLFLLGTLGGILICCIWCLFMRRSHSMYMCSLACCVRRPNSEHDSAGSVYPPPQYSRCGSFHQAPPPYSEVASKPDLYPLVITCGDGEGKAGGNYLMVHYFRNYVIRAPGSLSATSTAESLSSSFICNAANEANSIIPPPYSCASNYSDCGAGCGRSLLRSLSSLTDARPAAPAPAPAPPAPAPPAAPTSHARARTTSDSTNVRTRDSTQAFRDNLITSPVQPLDPTFDLDLELIDCEMYCEGGCKPRLGASPPAQRSPSACEQPYSPDAYALGHLFAGPSPDAAACESPPRPTSPTQSRESTLRRPSDERRTRRLESVKKTKARKSSLYMPLSVAYPGRPARPAPAPAPRAASRSAPATPCAGLVPRLPSLLTFTQRVSASRSSRLEEESNPLLADVESARPDHKF